MCSSVVMRLCGLRKFLTPDNRLRRWYAGVRTHCAPPRSLPGVAVESGTDDGNPNIPHGSLGECGGPDSWLPNSPHFQSQVFGDFDPSVLAFPQREAAGRRRQAPLPSRKCLRLGRLDYHALGDRIMSLGFILVIVLIVFLLGGFSGRFGGYGYGFGHGGIGVLGTVLIIVVVLMLLGRI